MTTVTSIGYAPESASPGVLSYWCELENARSPGGKTRVVAADGSPHWIVTVWETSGSGSTIVPESVIVPPTLTVDWLRVSPATVGVCWKTVSMAEVDPLRPPTSNVGVGERGPMGDGWGDAAGLEASVTVALIVAVVAPPGSGEA